MSRCVVLCCVVLYSDVMCRAVVCCVVLYCEIDFMVSGIRTTCTAILTLLVGFRWITTKAIDNDF